MSNLKEVFWVCAFQVLEEITKTLDLELKDRKEMGTQLEGLVSPIREVGFNPFSISKKKNWKMIIQEFDTNKKVGLESL